MVPVFLLVFVFALTGCSKKEPISVDTFKSIMTDEGYQIVDATDQYKEDFVENVSIAVKDDKYQIEFYDLNSESKAKTAYEANIEKFKELKGSSSMETNVTLGNYSTYKLTTDGKYCVVSRIGDTFIYIDVPSDYKTEVNDALEKLGY